MFVEEVNIFLISLTDAIIQDGSSRERKDEGSRAPLALFT